MTHYNTQRAHQGIGMVPPVERFRLAAADPYQPATPADSGHDGGVTWQDQRQAAPASPRVFRRVTSTGRVSLGGHRYHAGRWLAGQAVEVSVRDGLVELAHDGVLIATHARRHPPDKEPAVWRRQPVTRPARLPTTGLTVICEVDSSGAVSFAGTSYRVGNAYRRRQVEVRLVGDSVQISLDGALVRTHPAVHDRTREHGAFATPGGRPRRSNAA